jgi:hypothetical protein
VQTYRNSVPGGDEHRHPSSLSGAHHRLHVVLGEHSFNSDRGRPVAGNPVFDHLFNSQQAARHIVLGRRTDDIDGDQQRLSAGDAVDDTQPAPGQAGVDTQHPHAFPLPSRDRIAHAIPLSRQ